MWFLLMDAGAAGDPAALETHANALAQHRGDLVALPGAVDLPP